MTKYYFQSSIPIPDEMPRVKTATNFHFIPSQFLTEEAADDLDWFTSLGSKEVADLVAVRSVLPLPFPRGLKDDVVSGFRSSVDNSLFVYPVLLENFPKYVLVCCHSYLIC